MGLGITSTGGGDGEQRTPAIAYDARAGRLFRLDRSNASGAWETSKPEITNGFQAVMDIENIEVGWLSFPAGAAPDIRTQHYSLGVGDRPSDKHKQGFRVLMKLGKSSGGDLREMCSNAKVAIAGMDDLVDLYESQKAAHPGKLPVVALGGTTPITTTGKDAQGQKQTSTNYQPVWAIKSWVDRPPELVTKAAPVTAAASRTAAVQEPVAEEDLENEFG